MPNYIPGDEPVSKTVKKQKKPTPSQKAFAPVQTGRQ